MLLHPHHPRSLVSQTGSFVFFAGRTLKTGLECPARSLKAPIGSGYKSLAEHLVQFKMHDLDIRRLDDGDGIEKLQ